MGVWREGREEWENGGRGGRMEGGEGGMGEWREGREGWENGGMGEWREGRAMRRGHRKTCSVGNSRVDMQVMEEGGCGSDGGRV